MVMMKLCCVDVFEFIPKIYFPKFHKIIPYVIVHVGRVEVLYMDVS
jgi:hypothetical protein